MNVFYQEYLSKSIILIQINPNVVDHCREILNVELKIIPSFPRAILPFPFFSLYAPPHLILSGEPVAVWDPAICAIWEMPCKIPGHSEETINLFLDVFLPYTPEVRYVATTFNTFTFSIFQYSETQLLSDCTDGLSSAWWLS